jgi:hypothetical protein
VVSQLSTPVNAAFTTATTGGTLSAGTYYYRVVAVDGVGTSLASAETSKVTTGSTSTVTVNWTAVPGATGYKVYGRTTGAELYMATVSLNSTTTWTDTGSVTPSGALPTANTTGVVTAPTINATTAHQINGVALAAITTVGAGLSLASGTITTVGQQPVEKSCFATGIFTASQVLYYNKASIAYTIASGTTNQYFTLMTAATGSCTFTLLKNGTSFGTIAVAASGTTGTFTISSPVSFAVGDVLTMTAPSSADTTAAGAALSLYGVR